MQCCKTLRRLAQGWFEVANAHPGQGGLYPVDNPRAFPHQAVTSSENQCVNNEVGHFCFRRFSHVFGMSVPPKSCWNGKKEGLERKAMSRRPKRRDYLDAAIIASWRRHEEGEAEWGRRIKP